VSAYHAPRVATAIRAIFTSNDMVFVDAGVEGVGSSWRGKEDRGEVEDTNKKKTSRLQASGAGRDGWRVMFGFRLEFIFKRKSCRTWWMTSGKLRDV